MAKQTKKKKRPAVLVRLYPDDLARLSQECAEQCTPRENYCRRAILGMLMIDEAKRQKTR